MLKAQHPFKKFTLLSFVAVCAVSPFAHASSTATAPADIETSETGLFRDVYEQIFHYEGIQYLHLERLYRGIVGKKVRSANVNAYDEVADSYFFRNRHGARPLSVNELKKGPAITEGPDFSKGVEVTRGKFEGLHPGFFIRDGKGEEYLLKFDPADSLELTTAAEVIASRFMHAIGYNVPQYTITYFGYRSLGIADGATIYDDTGFKKALTKDRLEETLIFIPQNMDGLYRASASKIIDGEYKGFFGFDSRRRDDPRDLIDHERRREVRALKIFASWLNVYDMRESNTLDIWVENGGDSYLKHYLIDFNDSFGAAARGPKTAVMTHEHMVDYGEIVKSLFGLGFYKKDWEKRWELSQEAMPSSAVGYFDNRFFQPNKYKTQLPYYAFKDVTRADAFWASKIIMKFTDQDIQAVVEVGEYSDPADAQYVSRTLQERRDLIARYWFGQTTPIDAIDYRDGSLTFEDLEVKYAFDTAQPAYEVTILDGGKKLAKETFQSSPVNLSGLVKGQQNFDILVRKKDASAKKGLRPEVRIAIRDGSLSLIAHQD